MITQCTKTWLQRPYLIEHMKIYLTNISDNQLEAINYETAKYGHRRNIVPCSILSLFLQTANSANFINFVRQPHDIRMAVSCQPCDSRTIAKIAWIMCILRSCLRECCSAAARPKWRGVDKHNRYFFFSNFSSSRTGVVVDAKINK